MQILRLFSFVFSVIVGGGLLLSAAPSKAFHICVPTLLNCNCTFVFPCPVRDVNKSLQTSLAVAQERLLLDSLGLLRPDIDSLQTLVPPEAVGFLPRIPAQQLLTATFRGVNSANMLGAVAPLAGLAFGASPIAGSGLGLAGQGARIDNVFPPQWLSALPGMNNIITPAIGLMGASDALGGLPVIQRGLQITQGLGGASHQAMALRGQLLQQSFASLPSLGNASFASPNIATHAAAWLPPGGSLPSGGDFSSVFQAVTLSYAGHYGLAETRRRADAALAAVAVDAQAKALHIRHALRRHAEIFARLEAFLQAARTVGDDWRANATIQMALTAIDDEIREAEAMLLALRSSLLASQTIHAGSSAARSPLERGPIR